MTHTGLRAIPMFLASLASLSASIFAADDATAHIVPKPNEPGATHVRPVAVFGADDRRNIATHTDEAELSEKIGILHIAGAGFCTASCVAPGVILTASHCLIGTQQFAGPDLSRVSFTLGAQSRTTALAGDRARDMRRNIVAGTPSLRLKPPIGAAADWAIARLATPVCEAGVLPVSTLNRDEIEAQAQAGGIYQIAMHRDVTPDRLVRGGPCHIARSFAAAPAPAIELDFEDAGAILLHTCDTGMGSSGSPLLADGVNGPEIVGLNVGTYVLTKAATSTSLRGGETQQEASEPIANTAIDPVRFRRAVEDFTLATGALAPKPRRFR